MKVRTVARRDPELPLGKKDPCMPSPMELDMTKTVMALHMTKTMTMLMFLFVDINLLMLMFVCYCEKCGFEPNHAVVKNVFISFFS
jgi:hypothetical protein